MESMETERRVRICSYIDFVHEVAVNYFAFKGETTSWSSIQQYSWGIYTWFAADMIADITIAVSQCRILWKYRSGIRYKRTDYVVNTLMVYSVNTCLLTGLESILFVVTFVALPTTWVSIGLYCFQSKLITNAVLASLNARSSLRERLSQPVHGSGVLATDLGFVSTLQPALNSDYLSLSAPGSEVAQSSGRAVVEPKPAETKAAKSSTFVSTFVPV